MLSGEIRFTFMKNFIELEMGRSCAHTRMTCILKLLIIDKSDVWMALKKVKITEKRALFDI